MGEDVGEGWEDIEDFAIRAAFRVEISVSEVSLT
jgi:hypothetical protein